MTIGIDIREACRDIRTGKGQWTYAVCEELLRRPFPLVLFTDASLPASWKPLLHNRAIPVRIIRSERKGLWWHMDVARQLRRSIRVDWYISTVSYIVPVLAGSSTRMLTVVHDLIAFRHEPHERRATWIERMLLRRAIQASEAVCTVSDATRDDLLRQYAFLSPGKVHSVYAAATGEGGEMRKKGMHILSIGTLCPRKNQKRLTEAYLMLPDAMKNAYPLIFIGGRGWMDRDILDLISSSPFIAWKDKVDNATRDALLASSVLFAFPSLYEGFGLPILEAMQAGVPVLCSDCGGLKETAGEAAYIVDPLSVASIHDGLLHLLQDDAMRRTYVERGFQQARRYSWKRTADLLLAAMNIDTDA